MKHNHLAVSASLEIVQSGITSSPALRHLSGKEVLGLEANPGSTLACLEGKLWVTLEGDPEDYLLEAGQDMVLKGKGRLVVGAFGDASLRLA